MALFILILLLLTLGESFSFLLNTTTTGLTSTEFQLLAQYINDENQLRHRLESDFASLQQELKNTKNTLEQQLNNTISELGAVKYQLQQELTGLAKDFKNLSIAFAGTHTTGQALIGTNKTGKTF